MWNVDVWEYFSEVGALPENLPVSEVSLPIGSVFPFFIDMNKMLKK